MSRPCSSCERTSASRSPASRLRRRTRRPMAAQGHQPQAARLPPADPCAPRAAPGRSGPLPRPRPLPAAPGRPGLASGMRSQASARVQRPACGLRHQPGVSVRHPASGISPGSASAIRSQASAQPQLLVTVPSVSGSLRNIWAMRKIRWTISPLRIFRIARNIHDLLIRPCRLMLVRRERRHRPAGGDAHGHARRSLASALACSRRWCAQKSSSPELASSTRT
jgi:hypothetical protein